MPTPVRRQYLDLKARHPDAILFFRLGDFYETFDDDAKLVAQELDIALTSKPMGGGVRCPLAGVPVRSVEQHLSRLVAKGHRVAICEQLENPRAARGLVKRGVVRVVSPGTALEPALLEAGEAAACAALLITSPKRGRPQAGLAAADITTGAFHLAQLEAADAADLWQQAVSHLQRLGVRELLLPDGTAPPSALQLPVSSRPPREFRADEAERTLQAQFHAPAAAFGLDPAQPALGAAGAVLAYLQSALPTTAEQAEAQADEAAALRHLSPPRWFDAASRLQWDAATQRALSIVEGGYAEGSQKGPRTLLEVVDRCGSALGRRWLRAALSAPLLDPDRINQRLDRVEALTRRPALRRQLQADLRRLPDLERLFARAAARLALPPELASLARGILHAETLAAAIPEHAPDAEALTQLAAQLQPAPAAARLLAEALPERPAAEYGGGVVETGVDPEVDRHRQQRDDLREQMSQLEAVLREETEIPSLRVGYHRTFGYHIELTRTQARRAPAAWERRQSLRDRERFTEPRLRQLERELEAAEAALAEAELACVERLRDALTAEAPAVRRLAGAAARLDAACALATAAADRAWTRPLLDRSGELELQGGRHPIVEAAAPQGAFVPNDLHLADDGLHAPQLLLVTGPNMAGKSTYLRQAALIVILAQSGSFVPAERARVGLVDRIFARVGAHDDLAAGRSTFMVEMLETARLLHGATPRSLLLLDEIGRGTATWDGLAIAQAVTEALAGAFDPAVERGPRTLFATHFHELTALAGSQPRIANAAVQVEETAGGGVEFPYRIQPGAADRSYGVHVAAQAGLPPAVLDRARQLLSELENAPARLPNRKRRAPRHSPQLMLMPPPPHPILHDLAEIDVDGITPLEAISALYALRDQARDELRSLRPQQAASAADAGS